MILQREIIAKSQDWGVQSNIVEKDYVLGHFLNCFFNYGNNKERFVFKGGTCLRKCYFKNFRFSEDLDFTLLDNSFQINEDFIQSILTACTKQTGISFNLVKVENKFFLDEGKGFNCVITYWGPNHRRNMPIPPKERWMTKIELDFSFDEQILFPVKHLNILHPYSDNQTITGNPIPIYSLEEILTEKIRSFYQRSYKAPRDFYDVWYLLKYGNLSNWVQIAKVLKAKCAYKNKTIDTKLFQDENVIKTVSRSWNQSIAHHLPSDQLPDFDNLWLFLNDNLFERFIIL